MSGGLIFSPLRIPGLWTDLFDQNDGSALSSPEWRMAMLEDRRAELAEMEIAAYAAIGRRVLDIRSVLGESGVSLLGALFGLLDVYSPLEPGRSATHKRAAEVYLWAVRRR